MGMIIVSCDVMWINAVGATPYTFIVLSFGLLLTPTVGNSISHTEQRGPRSDCVGVARYGSHYGLALGVAFVGHLPRLRRATSRHHPLEERSAVLHGERPETRYHELVVDETRLELIAKVVPCPPEDWLERLECQREGVEVLLAVGHARGDTAQRM